MEYEHDELRKLLRIQHEPCEIFEDLQIHDLLYKNRKEYFELVEKWFVFWSKHPENVSFPQKMILSTDGVRGDFRIMPCQINYDGKMINTVKLVGTNEEEQVVSDKITVGKAFLFHPTDNFISAIFDACVMSSARTGVCAVVAFKHLAVKGKSAGILGCGRIGYYTSMFLSLIDGVERFVCYDSNSERIEDYKRLVEPFGIPVIVADSIETLLKQSDSLFLSTYSRKSLISASDIETYGIDFVSSVGADCNDYSEFDESIATLPGKIYVDVTHSVKCADLKKWVSNGLMSEDKVVEIKDVISGKYIPDEKNCRVFISTGFAFTDCISLDFLYTKRLEQR